MDEVRDVPAISETLPGYVAVTWFGVVAPPKTPAALAARIQADMRDALKDPDVIKRMADRSATPVGGTPNETAKFIRVESERWGKVVRDAGAQVD